MASFLFPFHLPQQLEIHSLHILQQEPGLTELDQESVKAEELKALNQLDNNPETAEEILKQQVSNNDAEKGLMSYLIFCLLYLSMALKVFCRRLAEVPGLY